MEYEGLYMIFFHYGRFGHLMDQCPLTIAQGIISASALPQADVPLLAMRTSSTGQTMHQPCRMIPTPL